ncbi:MAG: peptidoglycan recognition protein family protein [Clostridium sp.]|nr:peptidoglycan recognition protein family protein [Clostridium sp.]
MGTEPGRGKDAEAGTGPGERTRSRGRSGGTKRVSSGPKREEFPSRSGAKGSGSGGGAGRKGSPGGKAAALILALILGAGAGLGGGYCLWGWERPYTVDLKAVEVPDWVTQDFIRKNIFSRPDVSRKRVNNIVIHYVANPGTTARKNRDYFDGLADQDPQAQGASASSHFIVGLEGEVIQCIPVTEIAYANAPRNDDTVAIEVCHPDETGKFNEAAYDSLVKLTAWLCRELKLAPKDVIRHYDVNGKDCPKYFVEHEEDWKQFIKDVKEAMP